MILIVMIINLSKVNTPTGAIPYVLRNSALFYPATELPFGKPAAGDYDE